MAPPRSRQPTRTLAVFCAPRDYGAQNLPPPPSAAFECAEAPDSAASLLGGKLTVLSEPTLEELRQAAERVRPTHVYICGAFASASAANPVHGRLGPLAFAQQGGADDAGVCAGVAAALAGAGPQLGCVYLDVSPGAAALRVAEELHRRRQWPEVRGAVDAAPEEEEENDDDEHRPLRAPASVAVVGWPSDPPAALASHFARAFFGHLSSSSSPTPAEAHGVALLAAGAVAARGAGESGAGAGAADDAEDGRQGGHEASPPPPFPAVALPRAPDLLLVSAEGVSDAGESALPDARSVPRPRPSSLPPGVSGPAGVPGWAHAALLAPRCELRLRVAAAPGGVGVSSDLAARLCCLGEGLRALLAAEVRALELVLPPQQRQQQRESGGAEGASDKPPPPPPLLLEPLEPSPCPLPSACRAVRALVRTRSGAVIPVTAVLPEVVIHAANGDGNGNGSGSGNGRAGPAAATGNGNGPPSSRRPSLALLALRHAMLADALGLQLQLPPRDAPPPRARARPDVAGGLPGADCLARTSTWAAALLRCLALSSSSGGANEEVEVEEGQQQPPGAAETEAAASASVAAGGRALAAALGVTAVGCTPTRSLSPSDVERLYALVVPSASFVGGEEEGGEEEEQEEDDEDEGDGPERAAAALRLARPTAQEILLLASSAAAAAASLGRGKLGRRRIGKKRAHGGDKPLSSSSIVVPRADPPTPNPAADDSTALAPAAAAHAAATTAGAGCCLRPLSSAGANGHDDDANGEALLAADLAAFLKATSRAGGDGAALPQPLLGSSSSFRVDLPALYRAVASRGGFRAASAINWRGQVLPRCVADGGSGGGGGAAASLRLASAGHALRRIYASYLWEYERAHPADVSGGERCPLCGRGDDDDAGLPPAGDWLACDGCSAWVHYSCDDRSRRAAGSSAVVEALAPFEAYESEGQQYFCARCSGGGGGGQGEGGGAGVEAPPA